MAVKLAIPAEAFSVSSRKTKRQRVGGKDHLEFIRSLPCLVTGLTGYTEAAHVSYADERLGKLGRGYGRKEDDCWAIPLSASEHRKQHEMNEKEYWLKAGIDPCIIALALWRCSGDYETAEQIIRFAHKTALRD